MHPQLVSLEDMFCVPTTSNFVPVMKRILGERVARSKMFTVIIRTIGTLLTYSLKCSIFHD